MPLSGRNEGFSLIEALVASVVLLFVCLAVTGTVIAALEAGRVVEKRAVLEQLVESEAVRLAVLPFEPAAASPVSDWSLHPAPPSLLADVFPHALTERNTPQAYVRDDANGAVFITRTARDDVEVEREARFLRKGESGWQCLSLASLNGWALWQRQAMPSTTLQLVVIARQDGRTTQRRLRLTALPPVVHRLPDQEG